MGVLILLELAVSVINSRFDFRVTRGDESFRAAGRRVSVPRRLEPSI